MTCGGQQYAFAMSSLPDAPNNNKKKNCFCGRDGLLADADQTNIWLYKLFMIIMELKYVELRSSAAENSSSSNKQEVT